MSDESVPENHGDSLAVIFVSFCGKGNCQSSTVSSSLKARTQCVSSFFRYVSYCPFLLSSEIPRRSICNKSPLLTFNTEQSPNIATPLPCVYALHSHAFALYICIVCMHCITMPLPCVYTSHQCSHGEQILQCNI